MFGLRVPLLISLFCIVGQANASLIGSTFDYQLSAPCCGTVNSGSGITVIDPGQEISGILFGSTNVDFGANTLTIAIDLTGFFDIGDVLDWSFSNFVGDAITSLAQVGGNGTTLSSSFTSSSITLRTGNETNPPALYAYVYDIGTQSVPIANPLALLGLGLAGIAHKQRKRGKVA